MKFFVILSIFTVSAFGARLDNRYIPPPANAQSAGGFNLEAPRQALPSNVQNTYTAPTGGVQHNFQQQNYQRPGLNQGTFTSHSSGNGFQSVSAGSFSSNVQRPQSFQQRQPQQYQPATQASYQPAPQPNYQQSQPTYQQTQPQYNYRQQDGYNQASTTPIPILKCE